MAEYTSTNTFIAFSSLTFSPLPTLDDPMRLRTPERPADRRTLADSLDYGATIGQKSAECAAKAKNARNRSAGSNSNKSSRLLWEKRLDDFMGAKVCGLWGV